jgi:hypothetical protein
MNARLVGALIGGAIVAAIGVVFVTRALVQEPWQWRSYTPPAGKLTIDFPGIPQEKQIDQQTPKGTLTLHRFYVEKLDDKVDFAASYRVYSDELRASGVMPDADKAAEMVAATKGNSLVSKTPIQIDGFDGREIVIDNEAGYRVRARFVIVEDTLYAAMITRPKDWSEPAIEDRFLGSFHIH